MANRTTVEQLEQGISTHCLFVLRKIPAGDVKFCELKSIWIASGSSESREFFTAKSYMSERYIAIEAKSV